MLNTYVRNTLKEYNIDYQVEVDNGKWFRFVFKVNDENCHILTYERDYNVYLSCIIGDEKCHCLTSFEVLGTIYQMEQMIRRKLGLPREELF